MKHLFKNFLEDHKTYVLAENFWSKTIEKMLVDSKIPIRKWLATKYNDGERFYDGDPIFSLIHLEIPRALRIIQIEPKSENPFIKAWIEKQVDENEREIDVLAITLELCEETKQITINLVKWWFVKGMEN